MKKNNLSIAYQSILRSLQYINKGDAREFSIIWVSEFKARIVLDDSTITAIRVDQPELLDTAVSQYLEGFANKLAKIRFKQHFAHATCPL